MGEKKRNIWLDGEPHTVTDEYVQRFKKVRKRFFCKLCSHDFQVRDRYRWVYCNSTPGQTTGNFFVCGSCDGSDVKERGQQSCDMAQNWID